MQNILANAMQARMLLGYRFFILHSAFYIGLNSRGTRAVQSAIRNPQSAITNREVLGRD